MKYILMTQWRIGVLIVLTLVVSGGIIAYLIEHNRYDGVCLLKTLSFLSPDVMSYSEMREIASEGNSDRSRHMQSELILNYSYAEWGGCFPHDSHKFFNFLEETAARGWVESQYIYAILTGYSSSKNNIPEEYRDMEVSFSYLVDAAENGQKTAQHILSAAYAAGQWGDLLREDRICWPEHTETRRSREYEGVLCSYTDTVVNGKRGKGGLVIGQDSARSLAWLEEAINGPFSHSYLDAVSLKDLQYDLATRYRYGKYGAIQDREQALKLFSDLAAMDDARAMAQLAWMYTDEAGVESNVDTSLDWMKQALDSADDPEARDFYQAAYNQLSN